MSITARGTETEYEMPEGAALPSLDGLPQVNGTSGPAEQQLEAEYYDTDDLRLLRAGITLRRRRGGRDAGWHLKLPEGRGTRREIRLPLGQRRQVPRELAQLVRVHTRGASLRPVARLTTRRQTLVLLDKAGESLAEVASDDVSAQTMGDSTTVSQWRELEVELTGGDQRLLRAADALLRRDGLRPAGRSAKLERALAGQLPEPAKPPRLTPASPAGQVVLAYLRDQAETLKSLDPMVRRDEPDSVHQLRVATRRLRSTLRTFKRVTGGGDHLAAELKWLGGILGEARDAEVLDDHLQASLRTVPVEQLIGPVQARVQIHFAPVRAGVRTAVAAALDSQRYFWLLDELDQLIAESRLAPRAPSAPEASCPGRYAGLTGRRASG
jgi:inorganic triphosphatase YgiF